MEMTIFLNGQFVPESQATISVLDRGFLYGDGVFEVLRVVRGKPFRWVDHMERFQRGAAFLKIQPTFTPDELLAHTFKLIQRNQMPEALLRITLSRGVGPRGYSPQGANHPTLTMTLHPAPDTNGPPPAWRIVTASFRLPANEALAQFKTCNKLSQVLARAEADAAGADEALLLNTDGNVVEGSASNLFWIAGDSVCTPPLQSGILAGVTRLVVFEICKNLGLPVRETSIKPAELLHVQGAFVSVSSWGIVELATLDGNPVSQSDLTQKIRDEYRRMEQSGVG